MNECIINILFLFVSFIIGVIVGYQHNKEEIEREECKDLTIKPVVRMR